MRRLASMMAPALVVVAACRPVLPSPEIDIDDGTTGGGHGDTTDAGTTEAPGSTGPERTENSAGSGSGGSGAPPLPAGGTESTGSGTESTGSTGSGTESTGSESTGSTNSGTESTTGSQECGDGIHQDPEECDGLDLGGGTCEDLGFSEGDLACAVDCTHDVTSCIQTPSMGSLFFSEYVEGSHYNKALEIYNPTASAVDLGSCQVKIYFNGNNNPETTIQLAGTVGLNDVLVVCDDGISNKTLCDQTDTHNWFNGDDAVALVCNGLTLDVFGQIGLAPGVGTANETLRRSCTVSMGDTNGIDTFDPALQWNTFPVDDFSDLGQHTCP